MEVIVALFASGVGLYFFFKSSDQQQGPLRQALTYLGGSCLLVWLGVLLPGLSALVAFAIACALTNLIIQIYQARLAAVDAKNAPPPVREPPPPPPPPEEQYPRYASMVISQLKIPQKLLLDVERLVFEFPPTDEYKVDSYARTIQRIFSHLPILVDYDKRNVSLLALIGTLPSEEVQQSLRFARSALGSDLFDGITGLKAGITLPEKMRNEHQQIVGGIGHGKTELLKGMILDDVASGHSVVVIDSQNDMINELSTKIPLDKLILVDPINCPPRMNLFQSGTSSELFTYIFTSQGVEMTGKQSMYYTFVSHMVVAVGGNIHTMRKILEPGDYWRQHVDVLSETALSFFETEFSSKNNTTRQEILRRIFGLLANNTIAEMLGAVDNQIDIKDAIDTGKVILVSTDKNGIGNDAASLLGRIFIAQIMTAATSRQGIGERKRTYLYVDEFQDYSEDSPILFNLFEQARKREVGLIVAHQYLGQMQTRLVQALSAVTSIKFAGGVSIEDAKRLASQMHTTPEFITNQPKGTFAAWVKGYGTTPYPVKLGRSANTPDVSDLSFIRDAMRKKYGPTESGVVVPFKPSRSKKPPPDGSDVPESGEWPE